VSATIADAPTLLKGVFHYYAFLWKNVTQNKRNDDDGKTKHFLNIYLLFQLELSAWIWASSEILSLHRNVMRIVIVVVCDHEHDVMWYCDQKRQMHKGNVSKQNLFSKENISHNMDQSKINKFLPLPWYIIWKNLFIMVFYHCRYIVESFIIASTHHSHSTYSVLSSSCYSYSFEFSKTRTNNISLLC